METRPMTAPAAASGEAPPWKPKGVTPRTDYESHWAGSEKVVNVEFCRQLERELAEALADANHWRNRYSDAWNSLDHQAAAPSATDATLKKPAQVGGTIFSIGLPANMVIARAQREYEYQQTPEREAARIARSKEEMAKLMVCETCGADRKIEPCKARGGETFGTYILDSHSEISGL